MTIRIIEGDCRDVLRTLPDASVHSVVTDPPYELGFMGKAWDSTGIAYDADVWRECLRVLKPGGHLLAFGGSRTYHRLACAIEDAGFDVRDQIMWIYSRGFPKSHNLDKLRGEVFCDCEAEQKAEPDERGSQTRGAWPLCARCGKPNIPSGLGTALKPAHEPIVVARKPLIGTVAANVVAHGCGALNIDGCRIEGEKGECTRGAGGQNGRYGPIGAQGFIADDGNGRWPANVIHDGSEEVLAAFPYSKSGSLTAEQQRNGGFKGTKNCYGTADRGGSGEYSASSGSAARFFYCAKASRADRNAGCDDLQAKPLNWSSGEQSPGTFRSPNTDRSARNHHPTVKPTELMRYLCRLVTPPGGTVLDPFAGSGSTGRAADIEGFDAILIELNAEYAAIARRRVSGDAPLFSEVA